MDVYESLKKHFERNNCLLRLSGEIKTPFINANIEGMERAYKETKVS